MTEPTDTRSDEAKALSEARYAVMSRDELITALKESGASFDWMYSQARRANGIVFDLLEDKKMPLSDEQRTEMESFLADHLEYFNS